MAVAFQNSSGSQTQREPNENILEREEFLSAAGKIMAPLGVTEYGDLVVRDISTILWLMTEVFMMTIASST